jgi:hypothetical protein
MPYVAFAVLYVAVAVLVGRVCSLNGRLEGTIVYEPVTAEPGSASTAPASRGRAGTPATPPGRIAPRGADRPESHEVPAVR